MSIFQVNKRMIPHEVALSASYTRAGKFIQALAIQAFCFPFFASSTHALPSPASAQDMIDSSDLVAIVQGYYSRQSGCIKYGSLAQDNQKSDDQLASENKKDDENNQIIEKKRKQAKVDVQQTQDQCNVPFFKTKAKVLHIFSQKPVETSKKSADQYNKENQYNQRQYNHDGGHYRKNSAKWKQKQRRMATENSRISICWNDLPKGLIGGWSVPLYRGETAKLHLKFNRRYGCYTAVAWNAKELPDAVYTDGKSIDGKSNSKLGQSSKASNSSDINGASSANAGSNEAKDVSNERSAALNSKDKARNLIPTPLKRQCVCNIQKEDKLS